MSYVVDECLSFLVFFHASQYEVCIILYSSVFIVREFIVLKFVNRIEDDSTAGRRQSNIHEYHSQSNNICVRE